MVVDVSNYDLVDFGCSNGASLEFAFKHLGCETGLGVDIDPRKVSKTKALGYEAIQADLSEANNFQGRAKIVTLAHILEHIPSVRLAEQILRTATSIASEFVLVRQPWFDSDGLLAQMGLKFYWSDWRGHPNHMTSLQMYLALAAQLERGQLSSFSIWGHRPILHTSSELLVPLDGGRDRHHFEPATDSPKPSQALTFPCYRELVAFVGVSEKVNVDVLPEPFGQATCLLVGNKN